MSLEEFWENITTPGFLSASFDELSEICDEFKEEFQDLFEEGEELFSDGLKEMICNENKDYKTSIERRKDALLGLNDLHQKLLHARGVDDNWHDITTGVIDELESLSKEIENIEKEIGANHESITADLQKDFEHIKFRTISELLKLQWDLARILEMPETPSYQAPPVDENIIRVGPIGLFTSDKDKRISATNTYVEEIEVCKKAAESEIERLKHHGPYFDATIYANNEEQLITDFCQYNRNFNRQVFIWPKSTESQTEEARTKKLRLLLMLATGIRTIVEPALTKHGGSAITTGHHEELAKIAEVLNLEGQKKKEEEKSCAKEPFCSE